MTDTDTDIGTLIRERDGVLALLRQVQSIAGQPDRSRYSGSYSSNCMHAIAEIQALLNPQEQQDP